MTKKKSMVDELYIGKVDDNELRIVLTSVLPRGTQFRTEEVEYRTMTDEWALSLRYQHGQIIDAILGPAMTPELSQKITAEIERALLTSSADSVCRWTLFSLDPPVKLRREGCRIGVDAL